MRHGLVMLSSVITLSSLALVGYNATDGRNGTRRIDFPPLHEPTLEQRIDRVQLAEQERLVALDTRIRDLRHDEKRLGPDLDPQLEAMTSRLEAKVFEAHQSLYDLEEATDDNLARMRALMDNHIRDLEAEYARIRVALESVLEHAGR